MGGDDGNPIFTLTPRKANPNRIELIHNNTTKVRTIDLSLFLGVWVECTETIYIHPTSGNYSMIIKNIESGDTILDYSNNVLMTIRPDNDFKRPKWGIYRSLNDSSSLRDEAVRFADFSIQEQKVTNIEQSNKTLPKSFTLDQNYPNPFNPTTKISYSIPKSLKSESIKMKLTIHDLLGNEVAILANKKQNAGYYEVDFDGTELTSGIYFYRLEIYSAQKNNSFVQTKKMVLMK